MDALPPVVQRWLDGPIDPHAQRQLETVSQFYLTGLTAVSFLLSFFSSSVLLGLESFGAGLAVLLLAAVPAWPFLAKQPIKYLPVREAAKTA